MPFYAKNRHKVWHIIVSDLNKRETVTSLCGVPDFVPTCWGAPHVQRNLVCPFCLVKQSRHDGIEPGDFVQIVEHVDLPLHLRKLLGRIGEVTGIYSVNYPARMTISNEPRQIAFVDLKSRSGNASMTIVRKVPLVALDRLED